jgi:hypothetical protein
MPGSSRNQVWGKAAMCDYLLAAILRENSRLPAISQFAQKTWRRKFMAGTGSGRRGMSGRPRWLGGRQLRSSVTPGSSAVSSS